MAHRSWYYVHLAVTLMLGVSCVVLAYRLTAETHRADVEKSRADVEAQRREAVEKMTAAASPSGGVDISQTSGSSPSLARPNPDVVKSAPSLPTAPPLKSFAGEVAARRVVAAESTVYVRQIYGPLLDKLTIPPARQEELLALLAAEQSAATSTAHTAGVPTSIADRSQRIAAIVGYDQLGTFLDYEAKLFEHVRVQQLASRLILNEQPLTKVQREQLVELMVTERQRNAPREEIKTIKDLETRIAQQNDFDRRVLEGAGTFLSAKQLRILQEQSELRSARRAASLDAQKNRLAAGMGADRPLMYPPDE